MDFTRSEPLTYGLELELQIVQPQTGRLHPGCLTLLEELDRRKAPPLFAKEATLATIELNSSVQHHADGMEQEVRELVSLAREAAHSVGLDLRGGGTNVAQFWNERVMAPTERAQLLEQRFGFLPKRFSTYGMHVHIGMPDAESAIRVANVLQALCPLFIALSAASPFLQLSDTGLACARPIESMVYPQGGPMPHLPTWQALLDELQAIYATGLATSLKDIYWDVRPKPEFGTVEVRVFDTPLSVSKALRLASLTRELAGLALSGTLALAAPVPSSALRASRFLACRDGMEASLYDATRSKWLPAREWLSDLLQSIERNGPHEANSRQFESWRSLMTESPDYAKMRACWATYKAGANSMDERLAAHGAEMCAKLLH
jgi:carboxylate-amine ligase